MRSTAAARMASKHWSKDPPGEGREDNAEDDGLQTNGEAVTNMLNNCLGSGMLAVSLAISRSGLVVGLLLIVASALMNRFTLLLILECCSVAAVDVSYNTVARLALGPPGRLLVMLAFMGMGFGCLVSYVDASVDAVGGLLTLSGVEFSKPALFAIAALLNVPPTFLRSLKSVATLSAVAFVGALVVVACVFIQCGGGLLRDGLPAAEAIRWYPEDYGTLLAQLPTFALIFSIQAGGSIVVATLKDSSPANTAKVTANAYLLAFFCNCSVGVMAYLRFLDNTQGDVLSSFPAQSPVTIVAKFAILDLVVLSYMFMMIPCRVALLELLFGKNEARGEASWAQFLGTTVVVNILALTVAFCVPNVALVIGVNGAVSANLVAWVMPALIYVRVRSRPRVSGMEPRPMLSARNVPYFCLATFGLFSMVSGLVGLLG
mmetsp:Transcript_58202/g.165490  ORF Transcript_58202/g.165490 Transcript_58202/m.165490 type:complete len:432 (+) Transcript_58202:133-1428(+)